MADQDMERRSSPVVDQDAARSEEGGVFSPALRPVFLGNLTGQFVAADVRDIFERPHQPDSPEAPFDPISVERVDLKRGYCFVFLHDATSEEHKQRIQSFVNVINGMSVPNVSNALRSEFARGDGRIKRKEDDRRRKIQPSETLFVVNFHEETTKREDLQMLFEPFGELVRIDMKRNYAFVQFRTVEEASRAKEVTNGGKLDQSVLTVEFVARQRSGEGGGGGDGRRNHRDRGRRGGGGGGGYDRRGGPPPPDRYRRDDYRRRSPPRYERRRSRSRSRSPPRYRSRSPPRRRSSRSPSPGYYRRDRDYRGDDGVRRDRPPPPRGGGGPDDGEYYRRDDYRGDRGYR